MKRMILVSLLLVFCIAGNAQEKTRRQERMDRWKKDMEEFRLRSESDRKEEAELIHCCGIGQEMPCQKALLSLKQMLLHSGMAGVLW